MPYAWHITDQQGVYFVTFTIEQWVDVFTRKDYVEIIIASIKFCQIEKGLLVYAWVIMSNHLHMIISCNGENKLSNIIRDFKKFTSRKIVLAIEKNQVESRKRWLVHLLRRGAAGVKSEIAFWRDDNHPEEIYSSEFFFIKMEYIHDNPVKAGYVSIPEHWVWSSAGDFYGKKGLIELSYWND